MLKQYRELAIDWSRVFAVNIRFGQNGFWDGAEVIQNADDRLKEIWKGAGPVEIYADMPGGQLYPRTFTYDVHDKRNIWADVPTGEFAFVNHVWAVRTGAIVAAVLSIDKKQIDLTFDFGQGRSSKLSISPRPEFNQSASGLLVAIAGA